MKNKSAYRVIPVCCLSILALFGCAHTKTPAEPGVPARLTPASATHSDLTNLPPSKGPILVSVYGFRDQTGQYRPAPASSFSTAVTQGATSMLVKALIESKWFVPLEREGLQNLLTERKIIRAAQKQNQPTPQQQEQLRLDLPPLLASSIVLEGGIVSYESNVKTGGIGASYFGIGASGQYRMDQVTVNLRAVDVRSGRILTSVSTTKSIFSHEIQSGVFRFVKFKRLLEIEAGITRNEPQQLCVMDAIEAAVIHLVVAGVQANHWHLADPSDSQHPLFQSYLKDQREHQASDTARLTHPVETKEHQEQEQEATNEDPVVFNRMLDELNQNDIQIIATSSRQFALVPDTVALPQSVFTIDEHLGL